MRREPHLSDLAAMTRVYSEALRLKPDVVHGHGSKGGLYTRALGYLPGLKRAARVYTPHGGSFHRQPGHWLYIVVERIVESRTDLLLFESDYIARQYAEAVGNTGAMQRVAKNGLRPEEFSPVAAAPDAADFLYVGELSSFKGIDTLIEALASIHAAGAVTPRLAIVGSGHEYERLAAMVEHYDLNRHVAFYGALDAREAFTLGRIVVAPSRAESLPYVAMEAIAAGKTVIATDVGGLSEIFGPCRDRLIPRDDPAALARAMLCALGKDDAAVAAEHELLARHVAANFNVGVMVDFRPGRLSRNPGVLPRRPTRRCGGGDVTDLGLAAQPPQGFARRTFDYNKLVDWFFWLTVASGSVVFIEPSPYDFLILITIALWALGGFSVHRAVTLFIGLIVLWVLGGYIALIPYWDEPDPSNFMVYTLFITSTGVFYALFLSERTTRRTDLMLTGYVASCVLASAIAVTTWYGAFGADDEWVSHGRAMAPFKDPNVLGTYLVTGLLYLVQRLLLGRMRHFWLVAPSLALIVTALFLSFSRGSWGAAILSILMIIGFLIKTADTPKMRLRILSGAAVFFILAGVALAGALSVESVRDFFFQRATVSQDYDDAPNGRFGNQLRSIPMLMERPNGFGPLRFRLTFGLDPHNSYVNAFASNGWLGGFSFILLVLSTCYVGFRQCLTRHPWMRESQILFAATFAFFMQGLQIDLDHWRFFFLSLGGIWGIEASRQRWLRRQDGTTNAPAPLAPLEASHG